jgi:hypothetical protein
LPKFLKKQPAPEVTVENLKEDPNTLILIQNNTNIINLIINCKGQKDVLSFIFVENPEYINIVIKNPNGFPLLLVKIPVDNIYAFSRKQSCCYDFPIKSLLSSKESKYIKNCSYNIIYRKTTNEQGLSSVQFVYELYNKDNTNNTSFKQNNVNVDNLNVIDTIFKYSKNMYEISDLPYKNTFMSMNVLILKELTDVNSIISFVSKTVSQKIQYKFVITEKKLTFVLGSLRKEEVRELCTEENSILWNVGNEEKREFRLLPFECMFKTNYNKNYMNAERVYYIFGHFSGIYVFIKFISPIQIKTKPELPILNVIFPDKIQFFECYYCLEEKNNNTQS